MMASTGSRWPNRIVAAAAAAVAALIVSLLSMLLHALFNYRATAASSKLHDSSA
jgi:hypothetical protein